MNFPTELKYTKDHEWIRIEGDVATVGITEFAQRELGDIVYVEIETVGESLRSMMPWIAKNKLVDQSKN